jgi:uncharacterized protein YecT (DUF1311 family)
MVVLLGIAPTFAAQTQRDLNRDACAAYQHANQGLNATYAKILKDYSRDPVFLNKLKQAQRTWIAFRNADLAARFPESDKLAQYGSSYPACRCVVLAELTEQRAKELKVWAEGIPEGDVCQGSVRTAASLSRQVPSPRAHPSCGKAAGM